MSYNVLDQRSKFFLEAKLADQTSNEDKLLGRAAASTLDEAIAHQAAGSALPGQPGRRSRLARQQLLQPLPRRRRLAQRLAARQRDRHQQVPAHAGQPRGTQFAGANHELKYGLDCQEVKWESDVQRLNLYSGQGNNLFDAAERDRVHRLAAAARRPRGRPRPTPAATSCPGDRLLHPAGLLPSRAAERLRSGDTKSTNTALYVRDRFTVGDHWTFNVGVRGENQLHENDIGREVMDDTTISPRVSLSYDIEGNGRQLVTVFAGRSYHQLPQEAVNEFLMDQFNGYNGYERRLYCSPALIGRLRRVPAIGCQGFAARLHAEPRLRAARPAVGPGRSPAPSTRTSRPTTRTRRSWAASGSSARTGRSRPTRSGGRSTT